MWRKAVPWKDVSPEMEQTQFIQRVAGRGSKFHSIVPGIRHQPEDRLQTGPTLFGLELGGPG